MKTRHVYFRSRAQAGGFSLVEMLATITVIGIMSWIMLKAFTNVRRQSSEIVASELVETVNLGVKKFSQGSYKIK